MTVPAKHRQQILDEYVIKGFNYQDYSRTLAGLIENLLRYHRVQIHSVSFRAKTPESLAEKLSRPEKSYTRLSDITDLAGVRITTYFSEDVDSAAGILRSEFAIDETASVDKRVSSDPTRFGYR